MRTAACRDARQCPSRTAKLAAERPSRGTRQSRRCRAYRCRACVAVRGRTAVSLPCVLVSLPCDMPARQSTVLR
jgi:hypothetical protein